MKPVVIIPVKNKLDLTAALVTALKEQGGYDRLVVYDNGSTDETSNWCAENDVYCIPAIGMGLHEMWNAGLEIAARCDFPAVILNNDLELDGKPDWLKRLVAPFEHGWGALCPNYDDRLGFHAVEPLQGISAGREDSTGGLCGFAFALAPSVISWYSFPTEAKWWFGDTDLCRSLDDRGVGYGMVMDVGVTHIGGGSQTAKDHDLDAQCVADREWFESKWGAIA